MSKTKIVLATVYISIAAWLLYAQNIPGAVWFFLAFAHTFQALAFQDLYSSQTKEYRDYVHSVKSILDEYEQKRKDRISIIPPAITREDILKWDTFDIKVGHPVPFPQPDGSMATPTPWHTVSVPTPIAP